MEMLELGDEQLDDWVPVLVVKRFLHYFVDAYVNVFSETVGRTIKQAPEPSALTPAQLTPLHQ